MQRKILFCACALTLAAPQVQAAVPQDNPILPAVSAEERRINLVVSNARLSQVVTLLGEKYGVAILSDVYPERVEPIVPNLEIKGQGITAAITSIANQFHRKLIVVNGIYVLRYIFASGPGVNGPNAVVRFPADQMGTVTVTRTDGSEKATYLLPAKQITLEASFATVEETAALFQEKAGWNLLLPAQERNRRIVASLHKTSPGQFVEGLSVLLNVAPSVTLRQTDAQKELDEDERNRLPPRTRESARLRPELEKLFTPEQRQARERGERVSVPFKDMPADLRARVLEYAKMSADLIVKDRLVDWSRQMEFEVSFLPPQYSPFGIIGIMAYDPEGTRLRF